MTATFHKIDTESPNAISNAIDFFSTPSTNVSIARSNVNEILTLNPVTVVPLHFKIHSSNAYIDLSKCYLFTELRIRRQDTATGQWVDLTTGGADANVSVCQALALTMWKNIRVSLNGTQIYEGNSLQSYKSYFNFTLTYPEHVKSSYLNAADIIQMGGTPKRLVLAMRHVVHCSAKAVRRNSWQSWMQTFFVNQNF